MFFFKNFLKNDLYLRILICIFFCFYGFHISRYIYDGHHLGLVYSNSIDLLNGKKPYKEIFIQYGFITTLLHSFVMFIFNQKAIFIQLTTIFLYSISVFTISEIIKKKVNIFYAYLSTFLIFFNHPIPWLPWSNYIMFFFLVLSIFFLLNKNNYFWFAFFISIAVLARQELFISIIFSFFFWFIICLTKKKIIFKKNVSINLLFGFLIPIILFITYLYKYDILSYWYQYLNIPNLYLNLYETKSADLIFSYIMFFISDGFLSFIVTPQYLLISIILIFNTLFLLGFVFNKFNFDLKIIYISILSVFLSILSLKIEIFRVYTSVIIGVIPLLIFINDRPSFELKKRINISLISIMIYSFFFYNMGNNPIFTKTKFSDQKKVNIEQYNLYIWPQSKIDSLIFISKLTKKCDVEFLENITFDTLLGVNSKYKRIKLLPYEKTSLKNSDFHNYLNKIKNPNFHYFDKVNSEIKKNNIIVLLNSNNEYLDDKKIIFNSSYQLYKINQSLDPNKPNLLRIYYPKKCNI